MSLLVGVLAIGIYGGALYLVFRVVRWMLRGILQIDVSRERQGMKLRVRDWFRWDVAVNPGKGVASGSMQLNPPVKSSLVIGLVCMTIALVCSTVTRMIIPAVFACFSIYHLARWTRSLFTREDTT